MLKLVVLSETVLDREFPNKDGGRPWRFKEQEVKVEFPNGDRVTASVGLRARKDMPYALGSYTLSGSSFEVVRGRIQLKPDLELQPLVAEASARKSA